jgi:regulator of sirC expression with transglutaminase-like and TPR domain
MFVLNRWPLLVLLVALQSAAAHAQTLITDPATCARRAFAEPEQTLPLAKAWEEAGGGNAARHCVALALMAHGDFLQAGERLAALANEMTTPPTEASAAPPVDATRTHEAVRMHAQAAQAFQAANEPDRALAQIDAAIALAGNSVDLLLDRAVIAGTAGRYEDALHTLDNAAAIAPHRADIWLFRAGALRAMGLSSEAAVEIEQALKLKPNDPAALLERGAIRRILGDAPGARADWQAVQTLDAGSPLAREAAANLRMLDGK